MIRQVVSLLTLVLCVVTLAGCVVVSAAPPPRPHAYWVPGHDDGWRRIPGHWA
jgi:hypothetical protein